MFWTQNLLLYMEVNQLVFLFFVNTGAKIPRKTKQNNENSYPDAKDQRFLRTSCVLLCQDSRFIVRFCKTRAGTKRDDLRTENWPLLFRQKLSFPFLSLETLQNSRIGRHRNHVMLKHRYCMEQHMIKFDSWHVFPPKTADLVWPCCSLTPAYLSTIPA